MEPTTCTLCGAIDAELLFVGRDEWYGRTGEFPTWRCHECGLIYLNPRPSRAEIGQYYPTQYDPYARAIEDEPSWWRRFNRRLAMRKRLRLVQQWLPRPGRVLDVGCATGSFLAALREQGWQAQGVELSPYAADYARQRYSLDVFTGELQAAQLPDQAFNLVVLWDVLEHVYQPRETLLEAARVTAPGGVLLLVLPNPGSVEACLFGQYWAGWDTPRHLQVYSQPVIRRLLRETGWQMEAVRCVTGRIWLFNLSLEHWLQNRLKQAWLRQGIMAVMRSLPLRLLTLPYFWLVEWRGKGSVMAILARRDGVEQ